MGVLSPLSSMCFERRSTWQRVQVVTQREEAKMLRIGGIVLPDPEVMLRREVEAEVKWLGTLQGYTAQLLICPHCRAEFKTLRAYREHLEMED